MSVTEFAASRSVVEALQRLGSSSGDEAPRGPECSESRNGNIILDIPREELITCIGRNIDVAHGAIRILPGYLTCGAPLARKSPSTKTSRK